VVGAAVHVEPVTEERRTEVSTLGETDDGFVYSKVVVR
jgi:hypothetical protein